jgi:hypothetical protein
MLKPVSAPKQAIPKQECVQCEEFDQGTKHLLAQMFSQDELCLLTMLLGASVKVQHMALKQNENNVKLRMQCRRDMDFAATIAGKMLVGLDEEKRSHLLQVIKQHHGVVLNVKHEKCIHEKVETKDDPSH